MNILFLAHRIPYPPNKGDKIRSFNEIKYLSRKHNIYLGTLLECKSDNEYIKHLAKYCKDIFTVLAKNKFKLLLNGLHKQSYTVSYFYNPTLQKYVDRTVSEKKIDVIICFSSSMAEYIFCSSVLMDSKFRDIKLIMDYIDLDSDKWRQYSNFTRFPYRQIYRQENDRLFGYEIEINQVFQHSIFISQREIEIFRRLYPNARNCSVIQNGVDINYYTPKDRYVLHNPPVLVFTGVMDYFANIDGVRWFSEKIWPLIRAEIPNIQFYIVGMRPIKFVRELAKIEGITVTGYVEDIRKFYWMADVCVIPLRIARGQQNKVLEAMATGNAVVATSNANDGINCRENEDLIIADDAESFSSAVLSILRDENKRKQLAMNAINSIRHNYLWEMNLKKFDDLLV